MFWFIVVVLIVVGSILTPTGMFLLALSGIPRQASWRQAFSKVRDLPELPDTERVRARALGRAGKRCLVFGLAMLALGHVLRWWD